MSVPVRTLEEIYGDGFERQVKRYSDLVEAFTKKFGAAPDIICRAPGRVNVIGEHIDYHHFGVLPMAIEQDILCAASATRERRIRLSNKQPEYEEFDKPMWDLSITGHKWFDYWLCGFRAVVEHAQLERQVGMNCMVDGCVPRSAGLSSSSALVCSAAMAVAAANDVQLEPQAFASACMIAEQYVGTMGGGMDQSICFLAERGMAKHITFLPVGCESIQLPDCVTFVVANSLSEINKAAPGSQFNVRVVEGRAAVMMIGKYLQLDWQNMRRLYELKFVLQKSFDEMIDQMHDRFREPTPITRKEIQGFLEASDEEFESIVLSPTTKDMTKFQVRDRSLHVYGEAGRVEKACHLGTDINAANELGRLMNESHASCRDLYECSCPELDELTEVCKAGGALGSRLTGAGWGGCAVSIVPNGKVDSFMAYVREHYYAKNPERLARIDSALFATKPGSCASYVKL